MRQTTQPSSVFVVLLACATCGKSPSRVAEGPAWTFWGFVDSPDRQLAIAVANGEIATLLPSGVGSRIKMSSNPSAVEIAVGSGSSAMIIEGDVVHEIDAASGKQRWQQKLPNIDRGHGLVAIGKTTLAVAYSDGAEVLTLDSGRFLYTDQSRAMSGLYFDPSGGYVIVSKNEVRFVDESTGRVRWRRAIENVGTARLHGKSKESLLIIQDHAYEEVEIWQGRTIATGKCDDVASNEDMKGDCAGLPAVDATKENATRIARDVNGGDYVVLTHVAYDDQKGAASSATLIARDAVGRTRWRTMWPLPVAAKSLHVTTASGDVSAFVVPSAANGDVRVMIAFDDSTGQLLFQHTFDSRDTRLAGWASSCWMVVTSKAIDCLETQTGATTWSLGISGSQVGVWAIGGGDTLVAEGDPIALSRVDAGGRRLWKRSLPPNTTVTTPPVGGVPQLHDDPTNQSWHLSNDMGVLDSGRLTTIDFTTGALRGVSP